jgi:hypothetical protein
MLHCKMLQRSIETQNAQKEIFMTIAAMLLLASLLFVVTQVFE